MSFLDGLTNLPKNNYTEVAEKGNFSDLVNAATSNLQQDPECTRPRDTRGNPGAVNILDQKIDTVLYFGDIHPSKKNIDNFENAIKPFREHLCQGTLAIILGGDFTHPGEDDLTDMQPSVQLLEQYLLPLKLLFPNQIVILRGDHESVGSPYAEDFGKGTDFIPAWTLENGIEALLKSGLIWALGPNKPEFGPKAGKFSGIYQNLPDSERYVIGGKKFGRDTFNGSWHPFHRIEEKDAKQYLVFRGAEKLPSSRWVRIENDGDQVKFFLEDDDRDIICSLALNQSRAYGMFIEKIAGRKTLEILQLEFYDKLPLIVKGKCFAGVHGSPPERMSPRQVKPIIEALTFKELVELSNPSFRNQNLMAYRRLIFGRPIEGNTYTVTPRIVERFLVTIENDPKDLFIMAHTRPDHFLESFRKLQRNRGTELLLNRDIYAPFSKTWDHLIIDSQSPLCSHLIIENRRPHDNETIQELYKIATVTDGEDH